MEDKPFDKNDMDLYRQVAAILMPVSQQRLREVYPGGEGTAAQFVHYTSAEAALNIIKSKRLWMRNTAGMADYREVNYGHDMLLHAFHERKMRDEFIIAMDACLPGAAKEAIEGFDKNWGIIQRSTYISCLSEHYPKEDGHGRLSMWRSFAPTVARVAIVIRIPFFSTVTERLRVLFSPVGYLSQEEVCNELRLVIDNIKSNTTLLRDRVPPNILKSFIFVMLLAGVTCLKHDGFAEEKEWRAIYCPHVLLPPTPPVIKSELRVIAGVPQKVYELPLDETVSPELSDIDLSKILTRVIIGPSQYGYPMYEAFVDALTELGVSDAATKVVITGIPIRT